MITFPISIDPSLTLLIVRVIAGGVMMFYGWDKVKNPKSNAKDFAEMGFKPGWLWGSAVLFIEFFGGLALVLGIFVQFAAFLILIHMTTGTIWKMKTKREFGDYSYDILVAALVLVLLTYGAGLYSLL